ncbi:uncharacterized protein LOC112202761 [Rosa chinensis]|uniref:uncharacterized protein LOC112202761 n=1 Tax=Rosa chinensis TaxID=74649 RepID=UPI000D087FAC|nr:uncharacterized protein LOC112202761 [Rosa chinensis]
MSISPTGQQDLEQLVKLCDPPTTELVEILIESTNAAGCKVEERKASDYTYYCRICDENCDHSTETCPDRSGKFITVCRVCDCLPCKNEADHKEDHYERFFFCHLCSTIGQHLTEMCPDMDSDMGDEDWGSDIDDENRDEKGDFPENTQSAANAA